MEPTISLSIYIYYFFLFTIFLIPNSNTISYFEVKCLEKIKIVVGKVIVSKAIGIVILYIGKIRFVITRPGKGKRITERKEIN